MAAFRLWLLLHVPSDSNQKEQTITETCHSQGKRQKLRGSCHTSVQK